MSSTWILVLTVTNAFLVLFLGVALLFLYRQWGATVLRGADGINTHHGLRLGTRVPELLDADGNNRFAPKQEFVVFATTGCTICEEASYAYRDFLVLQERWALAYVLDGEENALPPDPLREVMDWERFEFITDPSRSIHGKYEVQVSPFVVVVSDQGEVVAKGLASAVDDLVALAIEAGDQSLTELQEDLKGGRRWVDRSEQTGDLIVRKTLDLVSGGVES